MQTRGVKEEEEETGLKLEREKLKGCYKGFRASKQIAVKAARGQGEDGRRWREGAVAGGGDAECWCLLKRGRERRRRRE